MITADHKVLSQDCESRSSHRNAVVVQDLGTPTDKPKVIHTDNYLEFSKVCEELFWNHCTSTLRRSETNGIFESAARRFKEGTSAVLLQFGLNVKDQSRLHLFGKKVLPGIFLGYAFYAEGHLER